MYVKKVDLQAPDVGQAFAQSLRETGFAVLGNHPVSNELVDEVFREWEGFFARSEEDKLKTLFDRESQAGFFPSTVSETAKGFDVKDIKEYFHFYDWGVFPEGMSDNTKILHTKMTAFAAELLQMIEDNTPASISQHFSMPLSKMINDSQRILLRILHYPPITGAEPAGAIRAADHEDINLITLLPAATADGLQVKDKQGNWHNIPAGHGDIIINTGDMLAECTEGYYKATTHRVVNPEGEKANEPRLSMPLFLHPADDVKLSERYTANEYRLERLRELGVY
ncbi:MAG: 2OG-Fe(II) oxygenase [Legionellales bacterium]|nr:2OG-Fe(II) oxygenase [Legionellales bacterium]|tara:strand:+ start:3930 stop:4775 length:846 start_codon:yes stop_codon:yes gene_type:complete